MRFILTPLGSGGDVYPFIGIACALRRRGHEVRIITNGHFRDVVERHGIPYTEFGTPEQYRQAIEHPDLWHPLRGFRTVMRFVREQRHLMEMIVRETGTDGVVIAHTLAFAARLLQDAGRQRCISIALQPATLRSVYQGPVMGGNHGMTRLPRFAQRGLWWAADRLLVDPVVQEILDPLQQELGLPRQRHYFDQWLHSPLLTIGLFPDWYAPVQPDWPASVRLASFPVCDTLSGREVPPELWQMLEGSRPVVFTAGTGNIQAHRFFDTAVQTCRESKRSGILLTTHRQQLPSSLPQGVRHFDFAPLSRILPRCAALVHHGGIGTTAAALAAGIPQIIMPLSHDQPDNAARVVRNHWGRRLWPKQFTATRLAPLLREVMVDETVANACGAAAKRLAPANGLERACDLILNAVP